MPHTHVHTIDVPNIVLNGSRNTPDVPYVCAVDVNAILIAANDGRELRVSGRVWLPLYTGYTQETGDAAETIRRALKKRGIETLDIELSHDMHDLSWRLKVCPRVDVQVPVGSAAGTPERIAHNDETLKMVVDTVEARLQATIKATGDKT
jgi:hypothetical protein